MHDATVRPDLLERFLAAPTIGPLYRPRPRALPHRKGVKSKPMERVFAWPRDLRAERRLMRPFSPSAQARSVAMGLRCERFGPRLMLAAAFFLIEREDWYYSESIWRLLMPLVRAGNGAAILIADGQMPRRILRQPVCTGVANNRALIRSAALGHPAAIYRIGAYMDYGDDGFPMCRPKALERFRRAAAMGHAHSIWIVGIDTLFGTPFVPQDRAAGLAMIERAARLKFTGALETLATFYEAGKQGFPKDLEKAAELRRCQDHGDAIDYT